ncbi:MAG: hypothetical protein IT306_25315 [Chloroflexi bacterium]|nr:hypothetical protein [Chloroflexota bacterium]
MREQLANAIRERTGLDEAMALQVADVALDFIKGQLPPALAPVLDGQAPDLSDPGALLGQLGGLGGQLGNLGAFGGLFGRRPEQG